MSENLIEGIQRQMNRVRDELIPAYKEIGPTGALGLIVLAACISEGEAAIASGDVVRMLRAYTALKECE